MGSIWVLPLLIFLLKQSVTQSWVLWLEVSKQINWAPPPDSQEPKLAQASNLEKNQKAKNKLQTSNINPSNRKTTKHSDNFFFCWKDHSFITESMTAEAEEMSLKDKGNEFFKAGNYLKAAALYTQAIKQDPSNPTLFRYSLLIEMQSLFGIWTIHLSDSNGFFNLLVVGLWILLKFLFMWLFCSRLIHLNASSCWKIDGIAFYANW